MVDGLGDGAAEVLALFFAAEVDFGLAQFGDRASGLPFNHEGLGLERRVAEFERETGSGAGADGEGKASFAVADAQGFEHVVARRKILEGKAPLGIGGASAVQFFDDQQYPAHGLVGFGVADLAGEGAAGGTGGYGQDQQQRDDPDRVR